MKKYEKLLKKLYSFFTFFERLKEFKIIPEKMTKEELWKLKHSKDKKDEEQFLKYKASYGAKMKLPKYDKDTYTGLVGEGGK